jgi:hypothetical protein
LFYAVTSGGQVVDHPRNEVFRPLSWRLLRHPQFKVLGAVVVSLAVFVVNVLPWMKLSIKVTFHNQPMFQNPSAVAIGNDSVPVLIYRTPLECFSATDLAGTRSGTSASPPLIGCLRKKLFTAVFTSHLNLCISALGRAKLFIARTARIFHPAVSAIGHTYVVKILSLAPFPIAFLRAAGAAIGMGCEHFKWFLACLASFGDFLWMRPHPLAESPSGVPTIERAVNRFPVQRRWEFCSAMFAVHLGALRKLASFSHMFIGTTTESPGMLYIHSRNGA